MQQYTFMSNSGELIVVTAVDEDQARERAMYKCWGPIKRQPSWLGSTWLGLGLSLQSVQPLEETL